MKATKTEDRSGEFGACWSFPNGVSVEQHLDGIDIGIGQACYRYVVDHYVVNLPDPENSDPDPVFEVSVYGSWRAAQNAAFAYARSI
ncbi:MAG: hypothetical protein GY876_03540 [Planctomycetes bacterium]|nr:hypothetical protein [Planctomycetota bacterium]MCP4887094.1 hypothetical protein [Planctomycetaceae bacterium]